MKRTIEVKNEEAYYRGNNIGYMASNIRKFFRLDNSRTYKYVITITEDGVFGFSPDAIYYVVRQYGQHVGIICRDSFDKLFFKPEVGMKYNITVKKVRKAKR